MDSYLVSLEALDRLKDPPPGVEVHGHIAMPEKKAIKGTPKQIAALVDLLDRGIPLDDATKAVEG